MRSVLVSGTPLHVFPAPLIPIVIVVQAPQAILGQSVLLSTNDPRGAIWYTAC